MTFERATYASTMIARYVALDAALVARGFPATSPWWLAQVRRYFATSARQAVFRVGRRGGKSSTLCRLAIIEGLYGAHVVPPGDIGVVAFISVSRDEASQRLRTIRAILDAIGVRHRPIDGGVELESKAVAFKVYTASISGVSGPTCISVLCDEVAKWKDAESGANPATEVLASVRPTMATQPRAKIVLSSSPLGTQDAHATAFAEGDSERQLVAYAPSWTANPTISESDTHALERDPRVWSREYLAVPQAGALAAFDADDVAAAFAPRAFGAAIGQRVCVIDASSGRKDRFTFGIAGFVQAGVAPRLDIEGHEPTEEDLQAHIMAILEQTSDERAAAHAGDVLRFDLVDGFDAEMTRRLGSAGVVSRIARIAKKHGANVVHADQREAFALASAFRSEGLRFKSHDWTATSKPEAIEIVRRWFRERTIALPAHDRLRQELALFEERISASGAFTFGARGNGHDDFVSLLITAALANLTGGLRGSGGSSHRPMGQDVRRYVSAIDF